MKLCAPGTFAFAVLSISAAAGEAQGSSPLLAQNCGGYGVTECPGAKTGSSHTDSEAAPAPAKEPTNPKDDCAKGGYGVAGCPGYSSKSSSGGSTTDEDAAKRLQGCGGYGANDCPKPSREAPILAMRATQLPPADPRRGFSDYARQ